MLSNLTTRYRTWRARIQAQSDYFDHDQAAGKHLAELGTAFAAPARANLLLLAAVEESHCARLHDPAFGPDDAGGGHTMAQSLTWSALLELALYTVEAAIVERRIRQYLTSAVLDTLPKHMHTEDTLIMAKRIEETAGHILSRMTQAPLASDRVRMAKVDLYEAVLPLVGVQAAEALATMRAPVPHLGGYELAN